MTSSLRFRLLQARTQEDQVRHEERTAFAARLGVDVDQVQPFDLLQGGTTADQVTDGVHAVLVGGSGAFSVLDDHAWIRDFIDTLGGLADQGFPTFASCFGYQGLVLALGGDVVHDEPHAEVGTYDLERLPAAASDPLFSSLPERFKAQEGHKDRASRLPTGVNDLARSARCPHQALKVTGKPVYATQFHPELTWTENRTRFERYFDMYAHAFGLDEARRMLDEGFAPSPQANALLRGFAELVAARVDVPPTR